MQYLCAGAFFGLLLADTVQYSSFFALYFALASIAFLFALVWQKKLKRKSDSILASLFLFSFATSFYIVRGQFVEEKAFAPDALYSKQNVELHITERKKESEYVRYEGKLVYAGKEYEVYVRMPLYPLFEVRDKLCGEASLLPKEEALISDDGRSTFNYDAYLREKGIAGVYSFPKLTKCSEDENTFLMTLKQKREDFSGLFEKHMGQREAHLSAATLFGSDELTKEENELYKKAGISHIVALSGFNISIIILFLFTIFFFLPFWPRMIISLGALTLYLLMVGVSGSLLRATVMAFISFLFLFRGSKTDAKRVLLLSGLFLALFFPESVLHDASLQLSFLAMMGVLFVYSAFFERLADRASGVMYLFLTLFLTTLSVTILIAPYTAYLFSTISLYGILTTMLVTFLIPFITVLGILFLLVLVTLPPLASLLSFPLSLCTSFVIVVAEKVSMLPQSVLYTSLSGEMLLFYYVLLCALGLSIKHVQKNRGDDGVNQKEGEKTVEKKVSSSEESEIVEGSIYF